MYALNFYSPLVADQLRTQRKTATIRLGDKSAKYKKGMIVTVLVGVRYGQREKVFDAVIDKVEVKRLGDLSPREIEHDNPEIRRADELARWLSQLYNREISEDDTVTVIRFSPDRRNHVLSAGETMFPPRAPFFTALPRKTSCRASQPAQPASGRPPSCTRVLCRIYLPGLRMELPKSSGGEAGRLHSSQSTANADAISAPQPGSGAATRRRTADRPPAVPPRSRRRSAIVNPQPTQNATQSPRVRRRSSWIQLRFGLATVSAPPNDAPRGRKPAWPAGRPARGLRCRTEKEGARGGTMGSPHASYRGSISERTRARTAWSSPAASAS